MDNLNEDDFGELPAPAARTIPVTLVARAAAAVAALLLLWMNVSLFSQVSTLEENISALKQNQSKELADISKQLDTVIKAFANHLKTLETNRTEAQGAVSTPLENIPPPRTIPTLPSLSRNLPIQPAPEPVKMEASANRSTNNDSLPSPISREDAAPRQNDSNNGWVVNITSVSDPESAHQELARLRNMGINAEISRAVSNGKVWYRIQVPDFASHDEASDARPALEDKLGIHDTWVGQRE